MKILLSFTLICLSTALNAFETEFHSNYWPSHLTTIDEILDPITSEKLLSKKQRGVLIRLVDGKLLVDFGRGGVHLVDIKDTDFVKEYQDVINHVTPKLYGNLTGMIGTRLTTFYKEHQRFHFDEMKKIKNMIILITPSDNSMTSEDLSKLTEAFSTIDKGILDNEMILFPGTNALYQAAKEIQSGLKFIMPGVNFAYQKALNLPYDKSNQKFYHLFKLDLNGKLLSSNVDIENIDELVTQLELILN